MKSNDINMIASAFKQRWPMSPEYREAIVKSLMATAIDPNGTDKRAKIAAAKALMEAEKQNQVDENVDQLQHDRNRFLEIAQRLGIRDRLVGIADSGTDQDSPIVIDSTNGTRRGHPTAKGKAK